MKRQHTKKDNYGREIVLRDPNTANKAGRADAGADAPPNTPPLKRVRFTCTQRNIIFVVKAPSPTPKAPSLIGASGFPEPVGGAESSSSAASPAL